MVATNRMASHIASHLPSRSELFGDSSVPRAKLEFVLSAKAMTEPFNYPCKFASICAARSNPRGQGIVGRAIDAGLRQTRLLTAPLPAEPIGIRKPYINLPRAA
jgi:hypothetical protein